MSVTARQSNTERIKYKNEFISPRPRTQPHEGDDGTPPPPPKPKTLVEPIREREAKLGIVWPNVVRIEHAYEPRLTLDLSRVHVLTLKRNGSMPSINMVDSAIGHGTYPATQPMFADYSVNIMQDQWGEKPRCYFIEGSVRASAVVDQAAAEIEMNWSLPWG